MLIAIADKSGCVLGSDEAIARIINVPMDLFSESLTALLAPDKKSGSPEQQGRRIVRLDEQPGLWLVNYEKYSAIANDEKRRSYFAKKQQESRARKDRASGGKPASLKSVTLLPGESSNVRLAKSGATDKEVSDHADSMLPDEQPK
jgi:hypothetical protein